MSPPRAASPCVLLVVTLLAALAAPARLHAREIIAPELRQAMAQAAEGERVAAYLVLEDQLRRRQLASLTRDHSPRARRAIVADALKSHAATKQRGARAILDAAVASGRAELRTVLWVGNAILFEAEPSVIHELSRLAGVDRIRAIRDMPAALQQDAAPAAATTAPAPPLFGTQGPYPLFEDFESGTLAAHWVVEVTGFGYADVTSANDPEGSFHLVMASSVGNTPSTASITVELDLTGETEVGIRFKHKEYGDEDDPEDGVFVSEDGITFHEVLSLQSAPETYQTVWVDLDSVLPGLGLAYTSTFHIRFQWADDFDIPTDGFAFDDIEIGPGVGFPPIALPEPNIVIQQGPMVWNQGYDGTGILIGSIDSGAAWTHSDLQNRIWTNPGEIDGNGQDDDGNGYVDDIRGWDFINDTPDILSTDPHGTRSIGLMVGDGTAGRITGMAPGATVVPTEVANEAEYWEAQQYLIDVGVDVISSSYSYKWPSRPDYHMFRQIAEMELAAGIIHANSIGNQGNQQTTHPIPFNVSTPGNVPSPFLHPHQVNEGRSSVVACGGVTFPTNTLFLASGRGPVAWEDLTLYDGAWPHTQDTDYWDYPYGGFGGGAPGLVKPDVVAFTDTVMTTEGLAGGGYVGYSGTSASTPQVAGAMALLRQVQPEALPRHIDGALQLTAADLGPAGKDNDFGAGRIRAWNAARRMVILAVNDPVEVTLGSSFTLNLYGDSNDFLFGFLNAPLLAPGDWNLPLGFLYLGIFPLDANGEMAVSVHVPNDPLIAGVTIWFQFAKPAVDQSWGSFQPYTTVPEPLIIE